MPEDGKTHVAAQLSAMKINGWYRATSIVLGLGGLGAGGAAVFITHVEAGPVALLVVGLLLLLIGMAGRLPSRIKIGDNEAAWDAVQDFVQKVAERTPNDEQPDLLADLTQMAKDAPQAASGALSTLAYEQLVTRMIYDAFLDLHEVTGTVSAGGRDEGVDMALNTSDGRTIAFQILYREQSLFTAAELYKVSGNLKDRSERVVPLIIVSHKDLTLAAQDLLYKRVNNGVYVAVVRDAQERHRLVGAIRAALAGDESIKYFAS